MSVVLSEKRGLRAIHPEQWVFSLDRWLRRWHGVYEFTAHRDCLFRAERCLAEESLLLCDGVRVRRGDPLLKVHLWNEHMPAMGQDGPTIAWARRASRAVDTSLRELAPATGAGPVTGAGCPPLSGSRTRSGRTVTRPPAPDTCLGVGVRHGHVSATRPVGLPDHLQRG